MVRPDDQAVQGENALPDRVYDINDALMSYIVRTIVVSPCEKQNLQIKDKKSSVSIGVSQQVPIVLGNSPKTSFFVPKSNKYDNLSLAKNDVKKWGPLASSVVCAKVQA
jgi:hypothetical protein